MGLTQKLQFFVKIELSFSALDLLYFWEKSNETLYRGRIYIVVVHLGIGFLARRKMSPRDLFAIAIFCEIELSFSALDLPYYWEESNETSYRERIYIVVVHLGIGFSRDEKCLHGTYSKIAIFRKNRTQLFRARSPILLRGIK